METLAILKNDTTNMICAHNVCNPVVVTTLGQHATAVAVPKWWVYVDICVISMPVTQMSSAIQSPIFVWQALEFLQWGVLCLVMVLKVLYS